VEWYVQKILNATLEVARLPTRDLPILDLLTHQLTRAEFPRRRRCFSGLVAIFCLTAALLLALPGSLFAAHPSGEDFLAAPF